MQKEIETFLIKEICEEFENVILSGIEEEKEKNNITYNMLDH